MKEFDSGTSGLTHDLIYWILTETGLQTFDDCIPLFLYE